MVGLVAEQFVARVFARGKVTIPLAVRDVLDLEDGDYVRVSITEVVRRSKGVMVKKRM